MSEFKKYKRRESVEVRDIEAFEIDRFREHGAMYFYEDLDLKNEYPIRINIMHEDLKNGSPKMGDKVARNPNNPNDQWLISKNDFEKGFIPEFVPEVNSKEENMIRIKSNIEKGKEAAGIYDSPKSICQEKKADNLDKAMSRELTADDIRAVQDIMNAIAARFGFEQDGSFKLVQGYHSLSPNSKTETSWRMYGRYCAQNLDDCRNIQYSFAYKLNDDGFDFGHAVAAAKAGKKVARKGWNGSGMFAYIVPAAAYPASTEIAKKHFVGDVPYRAYWALKTAQGDVATWAPSASDSLAEDWIIVE